MGKRTILLIAASLLLATHGAAQAVTIDFDTLANNASANLDPVALAHGVTFLSGFVTDDLDAFGDPIPGQTHIEAYADSDIRVVDPAPFGRAPAPSGTLTINALFDQLLIRFDSAKTLTGFGFSEDPSSFGDLFPVAVLFLDADGKTLFESTPFQPNSNRNHRYDFSFAAVSVSQILLPSTSKLYDDISVTLAASAVPEPASWAMMIGGFAVAGIALRRRAMAVRFA